MFKGVIQDVSLINIFTGVLGFTLVFRVNLAYDRWWSSRKSAETFGVKWFNVAVMGCVFEEFSATDAESRGLFRQRLCSLVSLLHAEAMRALDEGARNVSFCPSRGKFRAVVLKGVGNISDSV